MQKFYFLSIFSLFFFPAQHFALATDLQSLSLPSVVAIISKVNAQRVANGLPVLVENQALDQAALLKTQSLLGQEALVHTEASLGTPWWPLSQTGYDYQVVGENLAVNIFTASDLVSQWMNSPEHRVNILNAEARDIGVAVMAGYYQGQPSDYIVEYTALMKSPIAFSQSQTSDTKQGLVLGTTISVQASGVDPAEQKLIGVLLRQIVELLRQLLSLKQKIA